ncbi:MAG: thiamine pyrophosphate-binding protein [Candidatus Dormibacteraceae bacterium]
MADSTNGATTTVATAIAAALAAEGVDRIFGLPGGEVVPLLDACRRRGIAFVLCRHESDAGIMAAAYGRLTGRAGVVVTTLGPGASNLLLPIASSRLDREPLVAISAQVPDTWPETRIHQRLPLRQVFSPLTKATAALGPFDCARAVRHALRTAAEEPAGPVYLTISADVARGAAAGDGGLTDLPPRCGAGLDLGDPGEAAATVRQRLAAAQRPVLLVGLGTHPEDAPLIRRLVREWRLPVAVTPKAKGMVDETDPLFAGVVGGMAIDEVLTGGIRTADLVLGLGLDPTEIEGSWHDEVPMLWLLDAAWATGVTPSRELVAVRHDRLLNALLTSPPPRTWDDPMAAAREERRRVGDTIASARPGAVAPLAIVRALASAFPPETIVTTDVGSHKFLFWQFWPSRRPQTFLMSNGLSGMGYGLPAAIAAKLARPERPVLAAVGDGGFSMNSQELETAQRAGAPIVVAVLADRSLSMIRLAQRRRGIAPFGVDFDPIDSVLTAQACGVDGCRVGSEPELAAAARDALASGRTSVIEIPVEVEDYVPII